MDGEDELIECLAFDSELFATSGRQRVVEPIACWLNPFDESMAGMLIVCARQIWQRESNSEAG